MRLASLLALCFLGLAAPALAYPTSVINVPTGGVNPFKGYHLGVYNYLQPSVLSSPASPYSMMGSIAAGVLPYFDLAPGVSGGGLEVGADLLYAYLNLPAYQGQPIMVLPHAKFGLLKETNVLPGIAVGAFYLGTLDFATAPNVLHASVTKSLAYAATDLGQFTLGTYHGNPVALGSDNNGLMAGYYRNLPANLYVMGDYTSGSNPIGGLNLALGYGVSAKLSVTAGYFVSNIDRSNDKAFLFFDWVGDLPL